MELTLIGFNKYFLLSLKIYTRLQCIFSSFLCFNFHETAAKKSLRKRGCSSASFSAVPLTVQEKLTLLKSNHYFSKTYVFKYVYIAGHVQNIQHSAENCFISRICINPLKLKRIAGAARDDTH